jgi:hypothetical protein
VIRLLEDRLPIVEVTLPDGETVQLVAADFSDEGADQLAAALRRGLTGCDVRIVRLSRVLVVDAPRVPIRA